MSDSRELHYNDLADWLADVDSQTGPAGFHGQLTGLWCRSAQLPPDLALDEINQQAASWPALQRFALAVRDSLDDPDCAFTPVLPPDSAPLGLRVEALADWAEGLLFGIGHAGALDAGAVSEDAQELLRDLTEICKVEMDSADEAAEQAYSELVEFLKIAGQTLYVELHPAA